MSETTRDLDSLAAEAMETSPADPEVHGVDGLLRGAGGGLQSAGGGPVHLQHSDDDRGQDRNAVAEERIARILTAKGREALPYLRRKGRERFLREMTADGLSSGSAAAIIDRVEARLASEELDRALADLAGRVGT